MTVCDLNLEKLGSGRIFSPEIENHYGYAYHGTTTYHVEDIEKAGLIPCKTLSSDEEWNALIRLGAVVDGKLLEKIQGFRAMNRINFFTISEWALWYTKWRGGQGVSLYVKPLVEKIRAHRTIEITKSEARLIDELWHKICKVQEGLPVVYAVDLNGQESMCYNRSALAVQVEGRVEAKRLKAKINAFDFARHDEINIKALIPKAKILINPECGHFVSKMPLCD